MGWTAGRGYRWCWCEGRKEEERKGKEKDLRAKEGRSGKRTGREGEGERQ